MRLEFISKTAAWILFVAWCAGLFVAAGLLALSFLKPGWGPDRLFALSSYTPALYLVFVSLLAIRGLGRKSESIRHPSPFVKGWFLVCVVVAVVALLYAAYYSGAGTVTQTDGQWYRVGRSFAPMPITVERAIAYMWGNIRFHS